MKVIFVFISLIFGGIASGSVYATIIFDFKGTCSVDCSRFGLVDGTTFDESNVLGLFDGTDTSAGSELLTSDIEYFTLFGIDFLEGGFIFNPGTFIDGFGLGFLEDNVLAGFAISGRYNSFCYNYRPDATCSDGGFDTIVAGASIADGGSGHGKAEFIFADVPEPASLALLTLGLAGIAFSRKKKITS